ncbi:MAG: N-acetylglucosamine-6-phosphate deacetylase [Thermodesulfovibrionia bacterium]
MTDLIKHRGIIDLHTHGIGRYDTRTSNHEEVLKMAEFYLKAGITAFLPTVYSGTINEMRANMEAIRRAIKIQDSRFKTKRKTECGARILGVHLEGPFLNPLMAGAQDKRTLLKPTISSLKGLINGYEDIVKIITIAPELPGALKVIERCYEMGIRVNMGHSNATYEQALDGKKAGATGITHIFNAMRQVHHREIGLAGFGLIDDDIYIEVIADGIHIDMNMLRVILKVKNPERIILVSDSIGGNIYKRGEKLIGSPMNLCDSFKNLKDMGISVNDMERFVYDNPLRHLNISNI